MFGVRWEHPLSCPRVTQNCNSKLFVLTFQSESESDHEPELGEAGLAGMPELEEDVEDHGGEDAMSSRSGVSTVLFNYVSIRVTVSVTFSVVV